MNSIYKDGIKIIKFEKQGKYNYATLENENVIKSGQLCQIEIECVKCQRRNKIAYRSALNKKQYICGTCRHTGTSNPFFGKKHSDHTKSLSSINMKGRYSGSKNPFFGKEHSEHIKSLLSTKMKGRTGVLNHFFGKKHSVHTKEILSEATRTTEKLYSTEFKEIRSERFALLQRRLFEDDPVKYKENKRRGGLASAAKKDYNMNKLETHFLNLLVSNNITRFEFGVILGFKQFDFGNRDHRILVEIQGDYWHGNPAIYGEGLKPLNHTQKLKMEKDKEKLIFCQTHDLTLLCFWETDIRDTPNKIIEEIKDAIRTSKYCST